MDGETGKSDLKVEYSSRVFTVPKNLEYEYVIYERELEYTFVYSKTSIIRYLRSLHDVIWWNTIMCLSVLASIVMVMVEDYDKPRQTLFLVDAVFNLLYAVHIVAVAFIIYHRRSRVTMLELFGFVLDALTFTHYMVARTRTMRLIVYCLRLHRPLQYQWSNSNYNIKSSIWGSAFKITYLNFVLRIGWTVIWIYVHEYSQIKNKVYALNVTTTTTRTTTTTESTDISSGDTDTDTDGSDIDGTENANNSVLRVVQGRSLQTLLQKYTMTDFAELYFQINRMYIPVGTNIDLSKDLSRVLCALVQISGCLMLAGAAIATLSLVFSIYLAPEEDFRSRYRLIMKELENSRISNALKEKVEKFYMIYWKKHNAVSSAVLLPILPPTLTTAINFDIYFEATQKSRMLRDTPNFFLTEVMKIMTTIHFIPGDTIIDRGSLKHSMYYITYGDIEMLTAEDDQTAVMRMSRGTVLTPCSQCTVVSSGRSHVEIRAATFCTAQVLNCPLLWKKTLKQSKYNGRSAYLLWAFYEHFEKVKIHYRQRYHPRVLHLSSIKAFKYGLIALKKAKDSEGKMLMPREDVFLEIAGCYTTRSDIESTLRDESDAICLRLRFPCILQASSSLLDVWNSLVIILTMIVVITHPYNMAFATKPSKAIYAFDHLVSVVYFLDLIVFLSTGTNIEEGMVINFENTAMHQIRKPRFVINVFATLPIFRFVHDGHFSGINKLIKIPQLFSSLKNVKDNCVYHSHVLRFCTFTVLVVLICYLIAFVQQATMCFRFFQCDVLNFTHAPFWWARKLNDDVQGRVTFNLYWAVSIFTLTSHMVAYVKNYMPQNIYSISFLEVILGIRIFIEASYSASIMVTSALRQNFDSFIDSVKDFLVRKEMDPVLLHRFITYLELCWYTDHAYAITHKKHSIFYDLPAHVYEDIVAKQRSTYLLCIPFMKLLHRGELRAIASKARLFYTSPNEILLNTGDYTDEIFVIKQGICEMLCPMQRKSVGLLKPRSHFGSLECLLKFPSYYTFRAVTHVQIISVKRRLFYNRCYNKPQIKDVIEYVKEQPEFTVLQQHTFQSFAAYEYPEKPPNRQIFKQRRKFEKDYDFLVPFEQLGFLSMLRYVFPRFTIRPDSKYLKRYEWFRAFCALLASIVFPGYGYLVLHVPEIKSIAGFLDFAAYCDIFQRTIIGYYNEKGILIYHPSSTLAHYLRGAFIVDLVACVPLENLQPISTIGDYYRLDMLRQGLMLNRLLQLYRFFQTIEALNVYLRQDIMLVLKSLPLFVTLVNVLTMFVMLSSATIMYPKPGAMSQNLSYQIIPLNDRGGSWITLFSGVYRFNITENVINYHLGVYFWVVYETTTTGYGTIKPTNHRVMGVLFVGMVISSMITTYFSVRVISVRSNINVALCTFQEHKKDILVYLKKEKLSDSLKKLVRNYYDYNWDNMAGVETRSLLKLCDQVSLRTDCILHIYGATFKECPILPHKDMSLMRVISRCIRDAYFVKHMEIITLDDVIRDMYFVSKGTIHIRIVGKTVCKIIKLNRGSVFGDFERYTIRSPATVVANTNVHLLQIRSQKFHDITKDCPTVFDLIAKHRPHKAMYICTQTKDPRGQKRVKRKTLSTINVTETVQMKFRTEDVRVTIVLALITYCSMSIEIYNICYQINTKKIFTILYCLDVLFMFKIAFLVWVPNSKDSQKFQALRMKYLKSEFSYDVLSCIPIELFAFLSHPLNRPLWFSWLRIGRMFRLITLYKCLRRKRKKLSTNLAANTVLTVAVWFTFSIHVISCAFYYLGTLEDHASPKSSWRYSSKGKSLCNSQYICTIYFIMTTFTHNGVGDIMPGKHSEVIVVAVLQIISTMMYMVFVGEFSNIIQYESYRSFTFYSQFLQLKNYLQNNSVSDHLIDVIRQYCLHLWRESRGYQMPYFLTFAPTPLKLQVMTAAYLHHLDRHPVFRHCEPAFLRQLTGCLKLFTYNEDLMIVKENEITDSMYFIHEGTVQESSDKEGIMRIYVTREYFGEFQGLNRNEPYRYSYQSIHKSQILMLQLDDWEYLLEHFPRSKAAIYGGLMPDEPKSDDDLDVEPIKDLSVQKDDISLIKDLSSTFSFISRIKAVASAESTRLRTSHMIRFHASQNEEPEEVVENFSRPALINENVTSKSRRQSQSRPSRPSSNQGNTQRFSLRLPFTSPFKRPSAQNKAENFSRPSLINENVPSKSRRQSLSRPSRPSSDQANTQRFSLRLPFTSPFKRPSAQNKVEDDDDDSIDVFKLFAEEAHSKPSPLLTPITYNEGGQGNDFMQGNSEEYVQNQKSKMSLTPEVSLSGEPQEIPGNRQVFYLKDKNDKLSLDNNSFSQVEKAIVDEPTHKFSSIKKDIKQADNKIKNTIEEEKNLDLDEKPTYPQNIENTLDKNVQEQEFNNDVEKFQVYIKGKAFTTDKNLNINKIHDDDPRKERTRFVEQNDREKDSDEMVEIFVEDKSVTDDNIKYLKDDKEFDENARIRAFAATQATSDANKRLYEPEIKQNYVQNTDYMRAPAMTKEQEKVNNDEKNVSYNNDEQQMRSTMMEKDQISNEGGDDKFEVFLMGNAFKNNKKAESIESKEDGTSVSRGESIIVEDKGEFVDVQVQGKAFEKNKESEHKSDNEDSIP